MRETQHRRGTVQVSALLLLALAVLASVGPLSDALQESIVGSSIVNAAGVANSLEIDSVSSAGVSSSLARARRIAKLDVMLRAVSVSQTTAQTRLKWRKLVPYYAQYLVPEPIRQRLGWVPKSPTPLFRQGWVSRRNLRRTASFVIDNAHDLTVDFETVQRINRMLTADLVPAEHLGTKNYRRNSDHFYRWLVSSESQATKKSDPVAFAEHVHHQISALDAFPDGNGRTARAVADLILLQAGRGPALHDDMKVYFYQGNARAQLGRAAQQAYFRNAVRRGELLIEELSSNGPTEPR